MPSSFALHYGIGIERLSGKRARLSRRISRQPRFDLAYSFYPSHRFGNIYGSSWHDERDFAIIVFNKSEQTMDARAKTVRDILRAGDQYLVPFFQRHYSWKLKNWERLWDDLVSLLKPGKAGLHFMGPLVCTPFEKIPAEVARFQLIDGQQRLTTLTILLAAMRDLAREHQVLDLADEINEDYLVNKRQKGLERHKVVPRVGDRQVLFAVVNGSPADQTRRDGIVRSYRFFLSSVREFVRDEPAVKLRSLFTAATSRLSLVMVTIDGENPYDIFDSLNSTGLPLEQSDLIRNFIFMSVPMAEQQAFNDAHWQYFEALFIDEPPGSATLFYRDYLMRNGEFSDKGATYAHFKEATTLGNVSAAVGVVADLKTYAKYELMLRRPSTCDDEIIRKALMRLSQQKMTTAYPLAIHLLARVEKGTLSRDELIGCLTDIQSFVVRRLVCGESSRSYGEWFCEAIKRLGEQIRSDLQAYLLRRGWPDDAAFVPALQDFAIYRRDPSKCRAILEALEESHGHKEAVDLSKLTIEHVMPQTIRDDMHGRAWQEMLGANWAAVHQKYLDTLGNLTLTGYNPDIGNRRFETKRTNLEKSNVQLNSYFASLNAWTGKAIAKRGEILAVGVSKIWTRPASTELPWQPGKLNDTASDSDSEAEDDFTYEEYWTAFVGVLSVTDDSLEIEKISSASFFTFWTDRSASSFRIFMDDEEGCIGVELCFRGKYREPSLRIIEQDRAAIESELRETLEWEYDTNTTRATAYLDAVRLSDRADWPRQHTWLAQTLKKFYKVFSPRLLSSVDVETRKQLQLEFWQGFDKFSLANANPMADFGAAKSREWRACELAPWVNLWTALDIQENWIGVGLEFTGRKGRAIFETVRQQTTELARSTGLPVDQEENSDDSHLATYRYARVADPTCWPSYYRQLSESIALYEQFYKDVAAPLAIKRPHNS